MSMLTPEQKHRAAQYQAAYRKRHPERVKACLARHLSKPEVKAARAKAKREKYAKKSEAERRAPILLCLYGMTLAQYAELLTAQGGRCANPGCRSDKPEGRGKHFHVDHDHETKKVRGLLCNRCNVALGMVRDDVEKLLGLVTYVRQHEAATATVLPFVQKEGA